MVDEVLLNRVKKLINEKVITEEDNFVVKEEFKKNIKNWNSLSNLIEPTFGDCGVIMMHLALMEMCKNVSYSIDYDFTYKEYYKVGRLSRIETNEDNFWFKNGKLHRDNDLPAAVYFGDEMQWYKNGVRHRDNDLPAIMNPSECDVWYREGKLHRDNDQPAVIFSDGKKEWYQNGVLFREGGQHNVVSKKGRGTIEREGGDYRTYKDSNFELEPLY